MYGLQNKLSVTAALNIHARSDKVSIDNGAAFTTGAKAHIRISISFYLTRSVDELPLLDI